MRRAADEFGDRSCYRGRPARRPLAVRETKRTGGGGDEPHARRGLGVGGEPAVNVNLPPDATLLVYFRQFIAPHRARR